jgi:hypothetical protein
MRPFSRLFLFAALLLLPASSLLAQTAVDPSGHWQGAIQPPGTTLGFEIDLAKNGNGELEGTMSIPAQKIKGLPLGKVAIEGGSLNFHARADQTFRGILSADGRSMSGDFLVNGATVAFSMTRVGNARVEAPARSASITKELEGTWNGTLEVQGMPLRLALTMSNQPDGTATGRIVNLDEGGLQVPIAITQKASTVTLDSTVVLFSFAGTLNAAATELVGTFTQGALVVPLTFRHAAVTDGRK